MLHIYKKGQGYWTRLMSAIAAGTLTLMGGLWLSQQFANTTIGGLEPVYVKATAFSLVVLVFGLLTLRLLGSKRRVVDFMIATEGEMKKVNWSSRREIIGSTMVVIAMTIFIAVLIAILDFIFTWFFQTVNVLEGGN